MDPKKLSANGYAFYRPLFPNTTAEGRARNRRIEIRVIFSVPKQEKRPAR
jgi:chemotaxis protein MotB